MTALVAGAPSTEAERWKQINGEVITSPIS